MRHRIIELELSRPIEPIQLTAHEQGVALVARLDGELIGFRMEAHPAGERVGADVLTRIADTAFAQSVLEARVARELAPDRGSQQRLPGITIAICTKDRALRLERLLVSLAEPCAASPFTSTEILVIDNAPSDNSTAEAVARYPGVRHLVEPKVGLNFARNAALANATGELLAFLDDDVVVDRDWLQALATACRRAPDAGGFTGLVLPYRLDTKAQIMFEARGGFGRGFERREWRLTSFRHALHPAGAGLLGAGCNMAFDVALLRSLGGFDEALDTGAPLPGGGDLDIFYRVSRTGRAMIYEPRYAVYHEHRETLAQLRRQYWSWGLGMMAFLAKVMRTDREIRHRQLAMRRWWLFQQARSIITSAGRGNRLDLRLAFAELAGGVQGLLGEYGRSRRRVELIRRNQR